MVDVFRGFCWEDHAGCDFWPTSLALASNCQRLIHAGLYFASIFNNFERLFFNNLRFFFDKSAKVLEGVIGCRDDCMIDDG